MLKQMSDRRIIINSGILLLILSVSAIPVDAAPGRWEKKRPPASVKRYHTHYKHHYYPIGHRLRVLPAGYFGLSVGAAHYYYHSGVYYRHLGRDYVVVRAPVGALVHVLPAGYRTLHIGKRPYYYANGAYYLWNDVRRAYVVTEDPELETEQQIAAATEPGVQEIFVYPKNGQTQEQTSMDRYECYVWAVGQTGFDPGLGDGGSSSDYQRAMGACLEGRGYTVK